MNANVFKGYFLMISSGLVLIAALVLLILQWGNSATITLYGPAKSVNTLLLMVLSAVGGVVAVFLGKALLRGVIALRKGRQEQAIKLVTEQARQKNA